MRRRVVIIMVAAGTPAAIPAVRLVPVMPRPRGTGADSAMYTTTAAGATVWVPFIVFTIIIPVGSASAPFSTAAAAVPAAIIYYIAAAS